MTIRQHLDAIEQSGFYSQLFTDETESENSRIETVMKTELSLAFPLLSDAGKTVLLRAWSAHRNHQLTTSPSSAATSGEVRKMDAASEAEPGRETLQETVENLVESERFTDAQVEFIATEMLGIEKPAEEQ